MMLNSGQLFFSIHATQVSEPQPPPMHMPTPTAHAYFRPSPFCRRFPVFGGVTGRFPTEMGGMKSLIIFRFNNTNLTGEKD